MAEKTDRDTSRSVTPVTVAGTAAAALSPYVLDENTKIFFAGKPAKTERDMSRSIFLVGTPYQYAGLDDKTFTKTLAEFVKQAQKQEEELDSTVYYKILPGLDDAKRRFAEHKGDPRYRLNGCAGIEAYIRELGLKPATVRKWRQRAKERLLPREGKLPRLTGVQAEVAQALIGQGCKPNEARMLARAANGANFQECFKSALAQRAGLVAHTTEQAAANPATEPVKDKPAAKPTLKMWREQQIAIGKFRLKYFGNAAQDFVDRQRLSFASSPFKKVLGLIGNPDHADDLAAMAATLRAAAENLALLANVMEPELNSATASPKANAASEAHAKAIYPKNCKYIYVPGAIAEFAPLACNPYKHCGHKCKYCYVPSATKQDRDEFNSDAIPRDEFIELLTNDALKYKAGGVTDQVLLSYSSDPYHTGDTSLTRETIQAIQANSDLGICILTKGGTRALRDLDLFRLDKDCFATSLSSTNAALLKEWEPDSPSKEDRMDALKTFHDAGIFTWVSLEPVITPASSLAVIEATHPYVDLYKTGKMNARGTPSHRDTRTWTGKPT
jgi:transposase-like protein